MAIRNYVGARYVPKFADPVEWQANTSYEAMVIVTYNNASYTSKVPVPPTVGNPAENSMYWVLTGNYNAQVEEYRKATAEAQEHARDGICAVDEGNNTTATKSHKAHEYFWWKGKLYRAKEDINAGALLSDGGNVEEGNVAGGVSANSTDIYTLKGETYGNSNMIKILSDDITSHNYRINSLGTKTNTNTNDINDLKTKTDTNTNDINGLKTKDTEIEGKVNTNTNSINNLTTALSGKIQYKVYTTIRKRNAETNTTDNVGGVFNPSSPQGIVETIPNGATLIPISLDYHYFATDSEYNDSSNKGHDLLKCTVHIYPAFVINGKTGFRWLVQNPEPWTEIGYYIEYGVLEIK